MAPIFSRPHCANDSPLFYNGLRLGLPNDGAGYLVVIVFNLFGLNVAHIYFHMIIEHPSPCTIIYVIYCSPWYCLIMVTANI